jgi:CheY-like chemotaxis protein
VLGDDVRLKQVLWNVIKNAAKFTPVAGRILIETTALADSGELAVKVSDTGIGLTAEELPRIFEAFSQGNHAAADGPRRFGGLGLGLAICRRMVEMHGGSITAASGGLNQGATFLIKLPLLPKSKDPRAAADPARPAASPPSGAGRKRRQPIRLRRILLVEDHKPTSLVLNHLLTRRNYAVVAVASLAEARAVASRENFELLISDIGLPDGDGYELLAELHGRHGLVGIALTGYGMEEDVSRSQAAGFVAHLTKPITVEALDSALSAANDRLNA